MSVQWPNEERSVGAELAILAISGRTNGLMICPMAVWPSNLTSNGWLVIYQQAYEHTVRAFSPSLVQRALEPSLN
jgi:hypothetical protein